MKKLFVITLACSLSELIFGQTKVNPETFSFFKGSSHITTVSIYTSTMLTDSGNRPGIAFSNFALVINDGTEHGWAEAMTGLTYISRNKNLEIGVLVGLETIGFWRVSPWLYAKNKKGDLSLLLVYEYGEGSGGYSKTIALWRFAKSEKRKMEWRAGLFEDYPRIGPIIQINYRKCYLFASPCMNNMENGEWSAAIGFGAEL